MVIQINPQIIASREALSIAPRHKGVRQALEQGLAVARQQVPNAFIRLFDEPARAQADAQDRLLAAGLPGGPMSGMIVSVKDLFDVAGCPATGGSVVLDPTRSAAQGTAADQTPDAVAVARLRAAGAVLIGHTNLTEFAFSGVGLNPHHGQAANPVSSHLGLGQRITGGSTSGGAAALAAGACEASLGSDTGGSIRIPAALCGLVGFKNTQRHTPLQGCLPLSPSLDTTCALTPDVDSAVRVHEVLSARRLDTRAPRMGSLRLAVPTDVMMDGLEPAVAQAFERALSSLSAAGAEVRTVSWPELTEGSQMQAALSFAGVESHAWHRPWLETQGDRYDPRVASRILRGANALATDYLALQQRRADWIRRLNGRLADWDLALSPTVPCTAPEIAPLLHDDALFFETNARLLRNPSLVNLLDGCAISLPIQAPGDAPVGLMAWAGADQDARLLAVARAIEGTLSPRPTTERR